MKDPERLTTTGSDEQRALLRAARAVNVPAAAQEQVRRALDAEIAGRAPRGRRRKLLGLGAGGVLIAATAAAAQGLGGFERLWQALEGSGGGAPAQSGEPRPRLASPVAPAAPPPATTPAAQPGTGHRPRAQAQPSPSSPPPPQAHTPPLPAGPREQPGLDLAGFRRGFPEPAGGAPPAAAAPPPPAAAAGSLVIGRAGRGDVVLSAAGDRLRGQVHGVPVDLHITAKRITGRIGGDEVLLWIFGNRRADGTVGGRTLAFTFNPTRQGWIVGATLPDIGARVELDPGKLSFLPGCDRPLGAVANSPGRYQGTCADGAAARIDLPAPFLALPPLARMVVLGMLLPERDASLPEEERALFPRP
jgi:hypothetical protein